MLSLMQNLDSCVCVCVCEREREREREGGCGGRGGKWDSGEIEEGTIWCGGRRVPA